MKFEGLRGNGYHQNWPGRGDYVFQHLTSHFLPTFIGGRCPEVIVTVGDESRTYPQAISEIVIERSDPIPLDAGDFGTLQMTLMECNKVASADLKGKHFVHFIAHDRTVVSQCVDGKLGLGFFGANLDSVFHAIVTGDFLDGNVNQERTAFTFEDAVIDKIINEVCFKDIETFLEGPLTKLRAEQVEVIEEITSTYPSVAWGGTGELQAKVPSGELKADAIYGHLARERFRRDERQAQTIRGVLQRLKSDSVSPEDFADAIKSAGEAIENAEQRSLAEYIVRRKVVLDFIEILIEKVRNDTGSGSYQREDILHSFICPVRVQTINETSTKVAPAASHDLWIIDERLTFAQYFSSDVAFNKLSDEYDSTQRPDVLVFDYVHGLRQTKDDSKVLLVEFKKPGREDYDSNENPQFQVESYVQKLQSGKLKDVKGRPIKLDKNTVFYCFVIADIVGKMDNWTYSWQRTPDGRGRVYRPDSGFLGSIELMDWDALVDDAKARNQAFFDKAGITGKSFFSDF